MTHEDAIDRFLGPINFAVGYDGYKFFPESKLGEILRPGVIDPDVLIEGIAGALQIEVREVNQYLIHPETDTVSSMMKRLVDGLVENESR